VPACVSHTHTHSTFLHRCWLQQWLRLQRWKSWQTVTLSL